MRFIRIAQSFLTDLRYALRRLRNAPGYALTSILMLGLGLGATAAMLAVVDSVLLRPVALPHPEQLMVLEHAQGADIAQNFTHADIKALELGTPAFQTLATYNRFPRPITTPDGTSVLQTLDVSTNYFQAIGVPARLGRTFTKADRDAPVAVVSDAFWRSALNANPHVIGSTIKTEDRVVTIIGVMPAGLSLPMQSEAVVTLPQPISATEKNLGFDSADTLVRLRPGVSRAIAQAQAEAVFAREGAHAKDGSRLFVEPLGEVISSGEQPALLALLAACALLLAIACVNSANLQIARGTAQAGEMRVRSALGASRARLLQQIAMESVTVSLLGATAGMAIAWAAVHWARAAYGHEFPRFDELSLHPLVFACCALLAITVGMLAALAPAFAAMYGADKSLSVQANRTTRRSRLSGVLVAAEVALTCVLLATAGLFLRTFSALEHRPLGFDPHHVTILTLMPTNPAESDSADKQVSSNLLARLKTLPGVEAATTQTSLPFANVGIRMSSDVRIDGRVPRKDDSVDVDLISPGFARTLGFSMLQGRDLSSQDVTGAPLVCVVNEAFVRQFLQGTRVLGRSVEFPPVPDTPAALPFTIVGVMPDQQVGPAPADPMMHMSFDQYSASTKKAHFFLGIASEFAVRSALPQDALNHEIRVALKQTAPEFAEMGSMRMEDGAWGVMNNQRLALRLASGFGLIALVLSAIGIYGVLAYTVAQRTREIGIRMALGSTRAGAVNLVARQAGVMAFFGLAVGLFAAWPAGRAVRSFLFGVKPLDPLSLAATAALLLMVCAAAAAAPAWRATQVDPAEALRAE